VTFGGNKGALRILSLFLNYLEGLTAPQNRDCILSPNIGNALQSNPVAPIRAGLLRYLGTKSARR
jgi:hypothetical protein